MYEVFLLSILPSAWADHFFSWRVWTTKLKHVRLSKRSVNSSSQSFSHLGYRSGSQRSCTEARCNVEARSIFRNRLFKIMNNLPRNTALPLFFRPSEILLMIFPSETCKMISSIRLELKTWARTGNVALLVLRSSFWAQMHASCSCLFAVVRFCGNFFSRALIKFPLSQSFSLLLPANLILDAFQLKYNGSIAPLKASASTECGAEWSERNLRNLFR